MIQFEHRPNHWRIHGLHEQIVRTLLRGLLHQLPGLDLFAGARIDIGD